MASYEFLTTWLLDAPREDVWDAIWDSGEWPSWWRGVVEAVETDPGTRVRRRPPWPLRVAQPDPLPGPFRGGLDGGGSTALLVGAASGELEGIGRWRFFDEDGVTAAVYEWNVRTTKPWMNAVAPFAGPIFRWNHDQVMRWGGEGLAQHLGCRLLSAS